MPGLQRVLNMPGDARIIPELAYLCLNISEYARICVIMPKSASMAFVLHFSIEILCLKEP